MAALLRRLQRHAPRSLLLVITTSSPLRFCFTVMFWCSSFSDDSTFFFLRGFLVYGLGVRCPRVLGFWMRSSMLAENLRFHMHSVHCCLLQLKRFLVLPLIFLHHPKSQQSEQPYPTITMSKTKLIEYKPFDNHSSLNSYDPLICKDCKL